MGVIGILLMSSLALQPAQAASEAALQALAVGDCRTALRLVERPEDDAERLAVGNCHARMGQGEQALSVLAGVQDAGLAAYAGLIRGEALVAVGRWADAAAALQGLDLPGEAGERAALLRGRALVELGDYDAARGVLNGLLAGDLGQPGHVPGPGGADPGEVRWWLAHGAILRGEPDKAAPVLESLWARNPSSPWAGPAEAWLTARGRAPTAAVSPDVVRARSETFVKQRMYAEALALRDSLGESMSASEEARLAFRAKDYPRAVAAFATVSSPSSSQRFDHALATSRTGDYARAAQLYQALIDADPRSKQADEASFKLGYLAYDGGELDRAIPLFQAHLRRYPSSKHADEARWFIGWSLYKLGRVAEADDAFGALLDKHGNSELAPQAAYWRARIVDDRNDKPGAEAAYAKVIQRWPESGAAWFASQRLGRVERGVPTSGDRPTLPDALQTDAWQRGTALTRVGLLAWARDALAPLKGPARASGSQARVALALALVDAGDYVGAQTLARGLCGSPTSPGDPWALRACHPRPSAGLVESIARPAGLDPLLPAAVANAESALKPWVTSLAGARGLMQLMPDLAGRLHARRFGDAPYDPDDLYQPGYNAALGTLELTELLGRFRSAGVQPALPLAIAGYNGGPEAVERWLSAYETPPAADRFSEDIGYTETRRYVKKVLGYLQTYRLVYGDG